MSYHDLINSQIISYILQVVKEVVVQVPYENVGEVDGLGKKTGKSTSIVNDSFVQANLTLVFILLLNFVESHNSELINIARLVLSSTWKKFFTKKINVTDLFRNIIRYSV